MKYVKMLGLLAVAAAALMAFAGTASATSVTSSTGETPTIHATSTNATLHGAATIPCATSTVQGAVESHGPGVTVKGDIEKLTFGSCEPNHVTVLENGTGKFKTGSLEIHSGKNTGEGILTSSGTRITIQMTGIGISCVFETSSTTIGTYNNQVMTIESASIPRVAGDSGIFCGGNGTWTGEYTVTHPTDLTIH